ncbi:MAG: hypothetical protein K8I29_15380 [Alphaproteobacteria bacterium]|uniref:Uncharacterized protein n=1 Tax=Candidatus Nitrobium versatile TaxID=2884831 RepID=A0A953JEB1_9BACT|nr:hypothetical protein [Candidatus Nitrobium versatile]
MAPTDSTRILWSLSTSISMDPASAATAPLSTFSRIFSLLLKDSSLWNSSSAFFRVVMVDFSWANWEV